MLGLRFSSSGLRFRDTFRVPRERQKQLADLDSTCPDQLTAFAARAEREKFRGIAARSWET